VTKTLFTDNKQEWLFLQDPLDGGEPSFQIEESKWIDVQNKSPLVFLPSRSEVQSLLQSQKMLPWVTRKLGFCDLIINDSTGSNFYCLADEIPELTLSEQKVTLPSRNEFFFTANKECGLLFVKIAERMGFKKAIWILSPDQPLTQDTAFSLGGVCKLLASSQITSLKNAGDIFVHSYRDQEGGELTADLSFLNFLNPTGAYVDLRLSNEESPLIEEAKLLGLSTVSAQNSKNAFHRLLLSKLNKTRPST
jgi:hypothetical protein